MKCKTCKWWRSCMLGKECGSLERRDMIGFDNPPAEFGCVFHEARPEKKMCGSCGWFSRNHHLDPVTIQDTKFWHCGAKVGGIFLRGSAFSTPDRPGCQHWLAVCDVCDSEWISVEDELPDSAVDVWATCDGRVYKAFYADFWYHETKVGIFKGITHWKHMDRPEPPKLVKTRG